MQINCTNEELKNEIFDIARQFFQNSRFNDQEDEIVFDVEIALENEKCNVFVKYFKSEELLFEKKFFEKISSLNEKEVKKEMKLIVKKSVYLLLSEYFNRNLPWGIATGIRPTKMARDLLEKGNSFSEIEKILKEKYLFSKEKIKLTLEIIKNQTNCIKKDDKLIDFYVNIPICPSRCSYCSFISHEIGAVKNVLEDYLEYLCKEIQIAKKEIEKKWV